ncbi:hypothetical protein KY347_07145 [Candidatus Woesearchaeota archaeon]|nr:hypothetical protein [Candidatus Woesearchaeota archaeon]
MAGERRPALELQSKFKNKLKKYTIKIYWQLLIPQLSNRNFNKKIFKPRHLNPDYGRCKKELLD